jgi:signal transduction histidine kinase
MNPLPRSLLSRGALPIAAVSLAVLLTLLLPPLDQAPYAFFFAAVVVTAWYGGSWACLLALILSAVALDFFFLPPRFALGTGGDDSVRLGAFLFAGVITALLQGTRERLEVSLRRREQRKGESLAVMAHELRNFLSPVAAAVRVMRAQDVQGAAAERCLEIVERQTHHMSRLVSDLLDASRMEQGKLHLCMKPVNLTAVVAQAAEAVRPLAEARGHRLSTDLPSWPLALEGDAMRLEQIFMNLLINAAKYTEPGGRIGVKAERVWGDAVVRVTDSGVGIPDEKLEHVFDLFEQLRHGAPDGLGVGLSLVRGLARMHGGDVTAHSEGPGRGSEFVVRLPLSRKNA